MDMVVRVAEAIAKAAFDEGDGIVFDVHALTEEVCDTYLAQARAAVEAMREPTEAMDMAGVEAESFRSLGLLKVRHIWNAMIDAALSQKGE